MKIEDIQAEAESLMLEASKQGYVRDYTKILVLLKTLETDDRPSVKNIKSELYSLMALTRKRRTGEDQLYEAWLQAALTHNKSNKMANAMLAESKWQQYRDLFSDYQFPLIRETDNRTTKKKLADTYIERSSDILDTVVETLDALQKGQVVIDSMNSELLQKYDILIVILKEIETAATDLLNAAVDYEASVTGVFHTAVHFKDVKVHLETFGAVKERWESQFPEEEEQVKKKSATSSLNQLIGLHDVKKRINDFYKFLLYQKKRSGFGFISRDDISLNMVLTGNPGTGKTTLARLFAKIFHELGILPREEVIEADRAQLVGAYVGQTEENVRKLVERSLGGVLFIDEAYTLKRGDSSGNDFGQTAIDTLVSLMTSSEYAGKFSVIFAGYREEMRHFLQSNPGLRSRFPTSNFFDLPDYSLDELLRIAEEAASANDYILTEGARKILAERIEREKVDETFGNARTVKAVVMDAIFKKGAALSDSESLSILDYTTLTEDDFKIQEGYASSDPEAELEKLVGLSSIKKEMKQIEAFVKMQQLRRTHYLPHVPVQLHAVFTGNPGTGKTTVARLYSEILKRCGVLKRGHLITASRADFVAGYVGQTSIKTKKKIKEALGGVLFIDEAYSLLSGAEGDFGREVIDTLVDEMTRHNENLVVVLAGYPEEMNHLLSFNPGLRSRFKKFIHFPDYTPDELLKIIHSYAESYQYEITDDAEESIKEYLSDHRVEGNARFATNLVDEVIQTHAYRIMQKQDNPDLSLQLLQLQKKDFIDSFEKMERGER
ncbi:AAA family ATPase [Peribacillus kribbensis]|uniref:AAA family ATPase n=1 Tax=Peribacillus kribbensis TaxID=356658 RepID=UPI000421B5C1|nr:AAA family ATPase [Peribacillus kribbensis]